MTINLKKEAEEEHKEPITFTDEDFTGINLQSIIDNERIFIPYNKLPDSEENRTSYLDSLVAFIERKTEKYCSYFLVHESEPYEVSGFYIQAVPELKDKNGEYIRNNDYVYDKDGIKWHVNYYWKNNQLCILVDNNSGYVVIPNLSEFSLNSDKETTDTAEKVLDKCMKNENDESQSFSVGVVIAGLLFALLVIIGVVFIFTHLLDGLGEMMLDLTTRTVSESAPTQSDSDVSFIETFKYALREAISMLKIMFPIIISTISITFSVKTIKRLMNGRF